MTAPDCIWGANPYPGRKIIRELWMADGIENARAVLARRDERVDAYLQAITYARPELPLSFRQEWAAERYSVRHAEVLAKFSATTRGAA